MHRRRFIWRLAAVYWAAQIYWMSGSAKLTSDHTRSWLALLLEQWFHLRLPESSVRLVGLIVRKGAHMAEYAVLAFLVFQSLEGLLPSRQAGWCLAVVAAYALSDEFHQIFVPGRGASLVDWGIDLAGAATAIALLYHRRSQRPTVGS